MKQILFSRNFPATHKRKGEPTHFVEKILISLLYIDQISMSKAVEIGRELDLPGFKSMNEFRKVDYDPKNHTIRADKRWKAGEFFAPKVWSGKPYRSKCIQFAPPIEIKKVWDIVIKKEGHVYINGKQVLDWDLMEELATNDGLTRKDMGYWFHPSVQKKDFEGQIICWNEYVKY